MDLITTQSCSIDALYKRHLFPTRPEGASLRSSRKLGLNFILIFYSKSD